VFDVTKQIQTLNVYTPCTFLTNNISFALFILAYRYVLHLSTHADARVVFI